MTRETVWVDTPATEATSLMVARAILWTMREISVIVPVIDNGNDNMVAKLNTPVNRQGAI